ncbi:MAG: membrane protein insertion efficiency factor YidD [Bacteroidetes bacterium]|nr:membrane protein insertion efficiency factor YidD [Bacteroidota bacterium]
MRYLILFLLIMYLSTSFGQNEQNNINQKILNVSFENSIKKGPIKKKWFSFTRKSSYFNPLNYLGESVLFVYQNIFSEQIQASCNYEISCSEFTKLSIRRSGFFIGTLKGFNQLSECAPTAKYEHPAVYLNNEGKIINHFEEESK